MRILIAVVSSSLCTAASLGGQRNIAVDTRVVVVQMAGDTTRISFTVANSPTSQERLFRFLVDAPAPVVRIVTPSPPELWTARTRSQGVSVAAWGILGPIVPPGSTSPVLWFEAIGLPAVVSYWATGYFPVPPYQPVDESVEPPRGREAIAASGVPGLTIGVEPFPAEISLGNIVDRLLGLTSQACDPLGWISSAIVCANLQARLGDAGRAVSQADTSSARSSLANFLNELEQQHGPGLPTDDNAYWLLKVNAEFIQGRLGASGWRQGRPGTNVIVQVQVSQVRSRGDTIRVEYVFHNTTASQEELRRITVDAPSPALWISRPAPPWRTSSQAKSLSVARWTTLQPLLTPGTQSPPLAFDAIGLPAIVSYWAGGHYEPPEVGEYLAENPDEPVSVPAREALAYRAVEGKTVGVEPLPSDSTPGSLLVRLRGLTVQACDSLEWISSASVCANLRGRIDDASQALSHGDTSSARQSLERYLDELEPRHGPGLPVNDSAYWLLKVNAAFISTRLG